MERAWAKVVYEKQATDEDFRLIVIDLRFHDMAKHADLAIQPRPAPTAPSRSPSSTNHRERLVRQGLG